MSEKPLVMDLWPGGTPLDVGIEGEEHSVIAYLELERAGVPVELHVYSRGEHDFGVRRNDKQPSGWTDLLLSFLRAQCLLTSRG